MKRMKSKQGFTIMETLVAIFILTVAITATLTAASFGLQASFFSRDQITAYYLAEEAVEYIHNIRDTNIVGRQNWLNNIPAGCFENTQSGNCRIDVPENSMVSDSGSVVLRYSPSSPFEAGYTYDTNGTIPSKFSRTISIKKVDSLTNPQEILLTISMTWTSGTRNLSFVLHEELFNANNVNN